MSNDDPRKILVEVAIPVTVQLHVTWDGEETVIHTVELSPYGQMLTPRDIHENVDDDTMTVIDELTKAAFGSKE